MTGPNGEPSSRVADWSMGLWFVWFSMWFSFRVWFCIERDANLPVGETGGNEGKRDLTEGYHPVCTKEDGGCRQIGHRLHAFAA